MTVRSQLGGEFRAMFKLAWPLVLGEIGWMAMALVDTMMVGRVSAEAIGAVGLGSIVFYTVAIFGIGVLLGLDTLVSQAFGARRIDECHRCLLNAVYLSVPLSLLLMGLVWVCLPWLGRLGIQPAVLHDAVPYTRALLWSTFPLMLYAAFRRYLQAMNLVGPVMFALVTANLINLFGDWALIYGHLGAPAMGAVGSGWSTCISRIYMAGVLLAYILWHERRQDIGLRHVSRVPDPALIRSLIGLGVPAAMQMVLEIGVFAVVTALISRLNPVSLAAHQIVMNCVSFTYMVPLGVSSAAAVRVGQAIGRSDAAGVRRAGSAALAMGAGFMSCAALSFWLVPRYIARVFTPDAKVIEMVVTLLFVAAFFQLFDGCQVVVTGALRGTGDTHTPMICHGVGYWLIGLPVGYALGFGRGWGATGLWVGLSLALILVGIVLLYKWSRTVQPGSALSLRYDSARDCVLD